MLRRVFKLSPNGKLRPVDGHLQANARPNAVTDKVATLSTCYTFIHNLFDEVDNLVRPRVEIVRRLDGMRHGDERRAPDGPKRSDHILAAVIALREIGEVATDLAIDGLAFGTLRFLKLLRVSLVAEAIPKQVYGKDVEASI